VAVFARQYIINTNSAQTVNTVISNLIQYVTQQAGFCETIKYVGYYDQANSGCGALAAVVVKKFA